MGLGFVLVGLSAFLPLHAQLPALTVLPLPAPMPDPLPLRRVLVAPDQLPFLLEQARQGVLLELSRADFERRVQRAALAGDSVKNPPRLLECRYRATVQDDGLVGSAQWTILQSAAAPGILPVQPLNLALRKSLLDNRPAILGELDARSLGLLIEKTGLHTLSLDWSVRGEPSAAGLRLDLRIPACALTSFDLDLPADRVPRVAAEDGFLSGPLAGLTPERRLWRLECAGSSQIDLFIQNSTGPGQGSALVLARLQTKQRLSLNEVEADFDFNVEVLHGKVNELTFVCDPRLRPLSVSVRNSEIETWELRPARQPGTPVMLVVRLPEPFQGTALPVRVRSLSPVLPGEVWPCPGLTLAGAISLGETLSLQVSRDVQLDNWRLGDFALVRAVSDPNGNQTLTLRSGIRRAQLSDQDASPALERPSGRINPQQDEVRARQFTWWQLQSDGSSLTALVHYEVVRGRVFRLALRLPQDWKPEKVDVTPSELAGNWMVTHHDGRDALVIDLQRPLEASGRAILRVKLRPTETDASVLSQRVAEAGELSFAFPEVLPEGALLRDGGLAISVDPLFQATATASVAPANPVREEDSKGEPRKEEAFRTIRAQTAFSSSQTPWGSEAPNYYYPVSGRLVSGVVKLRSRPPRVEAHCTSEVVLASGRAAVVTRLRIQPQVGKPRTLDVFVSAPVSEPWNWRVVGNRNTVRSTERLHGAEVMRHLLAFAANNPVEAAGLLAVPPLHGSLWRLRFAEPLVEPLLLETTLDLAAQRPGTEISTHLGALMGPTPLHEAVGAALVQPQRPPSQDWNIPLLAVPAAERMAGEVKVHLARADGLEIESEGLRETSLSPQPGISPMWRSFQYGQPPLALRLHGRITSSESSPSVSVDAAHLTTFVYPDGRLLHRFTFELRHWKQRGFPLRLPGDAEFLAAKLDGRWITGSSVERLEDALVVTMPVASAAPVHRLEIFYDLHVPSWKLWARLESPSPVLPLLTTGYRRTWCLPDGVVPVDEGRLQRLAGPGASLGLRTVPEMMKGALSYVSAVGGDDWQSRQQHLLAEADAYLRNQRDDQHRRCLGDLLTYLVYEVFKGREPVVVDQRSLQEVGISVLTPLGQSEADKEKAPSVGQGLRPLEQLGLLCVPTPPALLVTTRAQWQTWQAAGSGYFSEDIQTAVSQAATGSHDPSGRFQSVVDWLCFHKDKFPGASDEDPETALPKVLPRSDGWSEWEPIAGSAATETLAVVREDTLGGIAVALAGTVILVGWRVRSSQGRWRYRLLVLCLAAGGLTILWLPTALSRLLWWPTFAAAIVATVWYFAVALRRSAGPVPAPKAVAAVLVFSLLCVGLPGRAVEPAPPTVWLLSGPSPDKESVLVAPELLEQLRVLSRRGAGQLHSAILLGARYEGASAAGGADFVAEFLAHSFEEEAELALPLGGVELQEALLDGHPAYPLALPGPQVGFRLKVTGRGLHTVRLRFKAASASVGPEQELRFTIPDLEHCQLLFTATPGARYLHAPFARGAQRATSNAQGTRLEADLGRSALLQVRWHQSDSQEALVQVRQLYLWDLKVSASRLLGVLQYSVSRGAITTLRIAVPDKMEIRRVESGPMPASGPVPPLKGWRLAGAGENRALQLDFQFPLTHGVQIFLELVPTAPLERSITLSLPTPQGTTPTPSLDNYVGYRVEGLEAELVEYRRVTGVEPFIFAGRWQLAGTEDPGPPQRAYTFQSGPGGAPFLRLNLTTLRPRFRGIQDILWRVGPRQADLAATIQLRGSEENLAVVAWEIPQEITVVEVSGKDIRSWSRAGSRVQVWLRQGTTETTLELIGWLPHQPEKPIGSFRIPCLTLAQAAPLITYVRVAADKGLRLQPHDLQDLWELPTLRPSPVECCYVSKQATYGGTLRVEEASSNSAARILTLMEMIDHRVTFSCVLEVRTTSAENRSLTLRLRNWQGQEVKLDAPGLAARLQHRDDSGTATWILDLRPGDRAVHQIKLTGSLPLASAGPWVVPEVSVTEIPLAERWLAVIGSQLQPDDARGVAPAETAPAVRSWPLLKTRVERAGSLVWKVEEEQWKLRLRLRSPGPESEPVRIFLDEQAAAIGDGRHWIHWADYWLYHEAGADLSVLLPNDAVFSRATLDGKEITPLQPSPRQLWLPLGDAAGLRRLRLYWTYAVDQEYLAQPNLAEPDLGGAVLVGAAEQNSSAWIVHTPPGYQVVRRGGNVVADNAVGRDLRRAAAQLRLSGFLAERVAGEPGTLFEQQLRSAQESFYRSCHSAEVRLMQTGSLGESDQVVRLDNLLARNTQLAQAQHFEKIRAQAEKDASTLLPRTVAALNEKASQPAGGAYHPEWEQQGTPSYWRGELRTIPLLQLTASEVQQTQRAFGLTALFVVLLLLAWTLPYFPRLVSWLFALWPEQLVLLGALGWLMISPNLAFGFLAVVGIGARLVYTGRWLVALTRRRAAVVASSGSVSS
jgi:hypothetical protein